MREVNAIASGALMSGELPIAAIVVQENSIIASAHTSERAEKRFLVHAELKALEAADKLGLSVAERRTSALYTNLEPCLMCMGACMSFFLGKVVFSLESKSDGAVHLVSDWSREGEDMPGYQVPTVIGGIVRSETIELFEEYALRHPIGAMTDWVKTLVRR